MKKNIILLIASVLTVFVQSVCAQTDTIAELKAIVVKTLVETDTYLTKASRNAWVKVENHKKAVVSYEAFEKAYTQLKPNLTSEINDQFVGVINVYSQLVTTEGLLYISEISTITAIAICSVQVEKITELLMKDKSEEIQRIIEEKKKEEERIKKEDERIRKEKEEKERILREQQEKERILEKTLKSNKYQISKKRSRVDFFYIETIIIGGNSIKKTRKKSIYKAGILLYDNWNSEFTNSTDNEKKLELSNNIIRLLDRLFELLSQETKTLEKSLKKEEDIKTIIKLFGL